VNNEFQVGIPKKF